MWPSVLMALGLLITSMFSILILASSVRDWTFPLSTYTFISRNRATVQLTIQVLANSLALINTTILCNLINRATRIHWKESPASLNIVRFWNGLCTRSVDWSVPLSLLLPLLAFILIIAAPAAIWVGALTPVATNVTSPAVLRVPAYQNVSLIREWPAELGRQGPLLSTEQGLFSYSVALQMQASLMTEASSATPMDGSVRELRVGDNVYIYVIFTINAVIILLVLVELIRTKNWKNISSVNYLDPGALMIASAAGATEHDRSYKGATSHRNERLQARLHELGNIVLEARGGLLSSVDTRHHEGI